ncbi:MAG TPA: methyltransferase domain-containing protein [Candidatus Dormibacteraeota bacterium]|nr:methyltransferase domain-containing protein [Candidatus Dormibacteraeota bacterium]
MADDPRASFGPVAANYSRSTFHTSSDRLQEVVDLVRPQPGDLALDVATGTGNTAFALAPLVRRVVGLDLTREMLDVAGRLTGERGIDNVNWVLGDASALPFADETFDIYVVRAAPHHFPRFDAFVQEAFRVLRAGRHAAFVDCAPPAPARDVLHEVEKRRDPSHVLSLTLDEWRARLEAAGFEVEMARARELDWEYDEWMRTMAVKPALAAELEAVIESAQGESRAQLHPERRAGRLWHAYWHCLIRARKPGLPT